MAYRRIFYGNDAIRDGRQTDSLALGLAGVNMTFAFAVQRSGSLRETHQAGLAGQLPHRPGDGILLAKLISLHAETT